MASESAFSEMGVNGVSEAVKFLFAQASEILRARRERREAVGSEKRAQTGDKLSVEPVVSATLAVPLSPAEAAVSDVDQCEPMLVELVEKTYSYAEGLRAVDMGDSGLMMRLVALREVIEAVFGQEVIFVGERVRERSAVLSVAQVLGEVEGRAIGLSMSALPTQSEMKVFVSAQKVASTGEVIGARIGDSPEPEARE